MSGGALDYGYERLERLAEAIEDQATDPAHKAFADHLRKAARVAKAIEWAWSGDTAEGSEIGEIVRFLNRGSRDGLLP